MSRIFTVVGHLTEEGEPTVVAVIEGQDYVVGGPVQRGEWGVWSWTGDAVDMEAAESLAYEKILADVAEDAEDPPVCPDCDEELVGEDPKYCPLCDKEES